MKGKTVFILFFLVTSIVSSALTVYPTDRMPPSKKTSYVVVLVIDGPRYSETFGDSSYKYIPHLGNQLKKEGAFYSNFRNNGPTYTISGHTAITTGVYQKMSNAGKKLPKNPSMFQYLLKSQALDKSQAWIVASKGKLEVLANSSAKKWWNLYMPSSYCGAKGNGADYVADNQTIQKVTELFSHKPPKLTLINLLAVDANAHQNDWKNYTQSIIQCDEYAFQIWQMIQENPLTKNRTTLFITNDHGRHLDGVKNGFVSHGDHCEGCRKISLLVLSPDVLKGQVIDNPAELIDLSKTISYLLNFEMPTSKGRILSELFEHQ